MSSPENAIPSEADHTHRLDFGRAGSVRLKLVYRPEIIDAAVDLPPALNRANRRFVRRWMNEIFRTLDPDPRGLRIVVKSKGRIVSTGFEHAGNILIFQAQGNGKDTL